MNDEYYANPEFSFADRIRKIRRDIANMTQSQFAHEIGVSQKVLAHWETGRAEPQDIVSIAKRIALRWRGISAAWVLGVETSPPAGPGGGGGQSHQPTDLPERTPRAAHLLQLPIAG